MIAVMDALFAPIARLLVARGVLFAEASQRLKRQYVRAALRQSGGDATDSRVSVLTGLQRRDIAALREGEGPKRRVNHLSRLVALWQTDPGYGGKPLPRTGDAPSFEALANAVSRDVHPRSMLDPLITAGTVSLGADDVVRLHATSYQPRAGSEEQIGYLADNAGDFLTLSVANVLEAAPFFERAAHYNGLSSEAVAELEAIFREGQMALLQRIGRDAAALQKAQPGAHRFRAGGYFYREEGE